MLCKPIEDNPTFRKMTVGYKVTKYSTRIQEDGTSLRSSPCTCAFHVWNRCLELWTKEELYTEGYLKSGKYPNKYDSAFKRKAHFSSEMKFAQAKAETKSYLKSIRELSGLMTGYRTEDLSSGRLTFVKIRRSRTSIKMESAARLSALSQGHQPEPNLLFADDDIVPPQGGTGEVTPKPDVTQTAHQKLFSSVKPEPEPNNSPTTAREMMIETLNHYQKDGMIPDDMKTTTSKLLEWLNNTPEAENNQEFWPKAINILKSIDSKIPEEGRLNHNLY